MQKRPLAESFYLCARCLRQSQRRRFSADSRRASSAAAATSSTTRDALPPPPPSSGIARIPNRRLISLHGTDSAKFLQGIVTANVQADSASGFYAAFLTAPGKVLADVFVYPTLGKRGSWSANASDVEGPGYLVEVDEAVADGLMKHLKRHKLRSKFKLRLLDEGELNVWSMWQEEERWRAHSSGGNGNDGGNESGILSLRDMRAPGMGQRMLVESQSSGSGFNGLTEAEEAPSSAYTIRRYLRGVAEGQSEILWDESLPMNCNMDLMGAIDFKKGCYIGQELTIRTHHTGVVRRRILPVALYDRGNGDPGALEYDSGTSLPTLGRNVDVRRDDGKKRATGKFIGGVGNVGLALCRLEQMSDLKISSEGSSFSADDRFLVQDTDGSEVGVKAFVPDWIRGQIREPKIQRRVE